MNEPETQTVTVTSGWRPTTHAALAAFTLLSDEFGSKMGKFDAVQPIRRENRPGRNAPCQCGSGAKYKRCCGRK